MPKNISIASKDNAGKRLSEGKTSWKKLADIFPTLFKTQPGVSTTGPIGIAKAVFDIAALGGSVAAGTYNLLPSNELLPDKAVIKSAFIHVPTAFGGGTNVAIGVNSTTDILSATAIGSLTTFTQSNAATTTVGVIPSIITNGATNITATTTGTMTSGKLVVFIEYVVSE